MPVEFIKDNKDVILGLWKITEDVEFFISKLDLSENEVKILKSFANESRKKHWLAYRILADRMINNNRHNEIKYDENRKPHLKNTEFHISVTHTGNYAAAVISKTTSVGIDIEKITPRILKIKHKFLNENELKFSEKENILEHLYIYWCSKEAMYKLYGKRDIDFRKNIFVEEFTVSEKGKTNGIIKTDKTEKQVNLFFEFFDGHLLVYAIG